MLPLSKLLTIIILSYIIIEALLREYHHRGHLTFIPPTLFLLLDARDRYVMAFSVLLGRIWNYTSPVLIPLIWELVLELFSTPGFLKTRFGQRGPMIAVSVVAVGFMVMDLMGSCGGVERDRWTGEIRRNFRSSRFQRSVGSAVLLGVVLIVS